MLESFLIKFNKLYYRTLPVAAYGSVPQIISVMNSCIPSDEKNYTELKVGLSPSKKICFICFIENPLKLTKNDFYFILKALWFSRYLNFCHDILVMLKKRLD